MAKETYKERKAREAAQARAEAETNKPSSEGESKPEEPGYKVNGRDGGDERKSSGTVALRYDESGAASSSMTETTWGKIKAIIDKTPGARERLLGASAGVAQTVTPEMVAPFYSAIGMINVMAARYIMKVPPEIATAIVPYNQDELTSMSEVTAAAVNENISKIPSWLLDLLRGGGNVAFGKMLVVLVVIHHNKLEALKIAQAGAGAQPVQQVVQ